MSRFSRPLSAIFVFVSLVSSALAAPVVTLAPNIGPPTKSVTVSGTGFGAFAAVDVFFDTMDLCLVFANGAGAVSCVIKVPKDAQPQNHWVSMLQRNTGTGSQKPFLVRTDMGQFHGRNAAHSGVNPFENTLNVNNVGDLDTLWTARIGPYGTKGTAVVAGGKVYVKGQDGNLYAFDAKAGTTIPGFPVGTGGAYNMSTPAVGYGRVFVGGIDSKLHAYNAATGAAVSGFPVSLGGDVESTPSLALGNVYVACSDWQLYAFNATSGVPVTGFPVSIGGWSFSSPTVADGKIYVGSTDNNIYAFDALTAAPIGGFPLATGGDINSTVAAASALGFVGSGDHSLYGFNLFNGAPLSGFPAVTGLSIASSPAIAGGKVYFGSDDGEFTADFTTGGQAWSLTLDSLARGSPMVANGVVYTNSLYRIYALAAASGAILWSAGITTGELNSPVVADGTVYFASSYGPLYAFTVNGQAPASSLPGGTLGVIPALSSLKPDLSLKAVGQ